MYLFGPTVRNRVLQMGKVSREAVEACDCVLKKKKADYLSSYLDQACRDAGAGRDDGLETAVVHHEVTHCNREGEEAALESRLRFKLH